jgi:hypothetical protein
LLVETQPPGEGQNDRDVWTYGEFGSIINHLLEVRHGLGTGTTEGLAKSIRHTWVSATSRHEGIRLTESENGIETFWASPLGKVP